MMLEAEPVRNAPVICLDIGGTSIRAGVVVLGTQPTVTSRLRTATLPQEGASAVLQRALDLAAEAHKQAPEADGVAVASAGVIGPGTGRVTSATELIPGWAGTELGETLSRKLGLPCTVLNDVHAHGVGEFSFGQGAGSSSAVVVAVGTGLGGAFFNAGELVRGPSGHAGHIGHVHHAEARGLRCSCGREGHLEVVASGSGMVQRYRQLKRSHDPPASDAAAVVAHAEDGVASAEQVVRAGAAALGESLGSLANSWDPERVILTGSVAGAGDLWWQELENGYRRSAMEALRDRPLLRGSLGDDAPLLGGAAHHQQSEQRRGSVS